MSQIFIYNCYLCKERTARRFPETYNVEKELCICCIKADEKKYKKKEKKNKKEKKEKNITKSQKITYKENNQYSGLGFSHNPLFNNPLSYRKQK